MTSNSDRIPATIHTREEALLACRTALARWPGERDAIDRAHAALRHLGTIARDESIAPDQMIIELKRTLHDALPTYGGTDAEAEIARAGLIKFAIDAYYAARI